MTTQTDDDMTHDELLEEADAVIHPQWEQEYHISEGPVQGLISIPVRWTGERWETLDGLALELMTWYHMTIPDKLEEEAYAEGTMAERADHIIEGSFPTTVRTDLGNVYMDRHLDETVEDWVKKIKVHSGADAYESIERDPVPGAYI